MYRIADTLRLEAGKGKRLLAGHPESANLSIDRSAIRRFRCDPADFTENMCEPYRCEEFLKIAKAHAGDPIAWI